MKPAIVGIAGPALLDAEAALLRAHPPAGIILFARNIQDPIQLAALVAALRDVLPGNAVLMVDQEGGRVARLRPPHWRAHPPAGAIGGCTGNPRRRAARRLADRGADRAGLRRRGVRCRRRPGAGSGSTRVRTT